MNRINHPFIYEIGEEKKKSFRRLVGLLLALEMKRLRNENVLLKKSSQPFTHM
jgi:hypothetical protein